MDRSCLAYVAAVTVLVLVAAIVHSAIFACRPPPPKQIHQTLFTSHKPPFEELPVCLKKNLETMRDMNPDLTFVYFSDADVDAWMRANASASEIQAFDQLNVGAARADLFRIVYMFQAGGVWVDADLTALCISERSPMSARLELFDMGFKNFSYILIGCTPGHPLLRKTLDMIVERVCGTESLMTVSMTGPHVLQDAFKIMYKRNSDTQEFGLFHSGTLHEFRYSSGKCGNVKIACYNDAMREMNVHRWQAVQDPRGDLSGHEVN